MPFCSKCGHELAGAVKFCNSCGYKIEKDELEVLIKPEEVERTDEQKTEDDSDLDQPSQRYEYTPPGATIKTRIPQSTRCVKCNTKTENICFFCNYAVCPEHSVDMQILADKVKIGGSIRSCPKCADRRDGTKPSSEEAAEMGFFFNIKPYHEWKIVEKDSTD